MTAETKSSFPQKVPFDARPCRVEKENEMKKGKGKVKKKNSTLIRMFLEMMMILYPLDIIRGSTSLLEKEEIEEED